MPVTNANAQQITHHVAPSTKSPTKAYYKRLYLSSHATAERQEKTLSRLSAKCISLQAQNKLLSKQLRDEKKALNKLLHRAAANAKAAMKDTLCLLDQIRLERDLAVKKAEQESLKVNDAKNSSKAALL